MFNENGHAMSLIPVCQTIDLSYDDIDGLNYLYP